MDVRHQHFCRSQQEKGAPVADQSSRHSFDSLYRRYYHIFRVSAKNVTSMGSPSLRVKGARGDPRVSTSPCTTPAPTEMVIFSVACSMQRVFFLPISALLEL